MRYFIIIITLLIAFTACKTEVKEEQKEKQPHYTEVLKEMQTNNVQTAIAIEAIDGGTYTYVKLKENDKVFWAAVSAQPIVIGNFYQYKDAFEMKGFHSKTLNRDFESIWFINDFWAGQLDIQQTSVSDKKDPNKTNQLRSPIAPAEGGYSLADVFKKKTDLKDQIIIVKGEVVKINLGIMSLNWIHIQDGTAYNGIFDLTITTSQDINFKVGEIITFKGKLALNKDFGSGYMYDYILEESVRQ